MRALHVKCQCQMAVMLRSLTITRWWWRQQNNNLVAWADPLTEGVKCWEYIILRVVWRPLENTFVQAFGGMSATAENNVRCCTQQWYMYTSCYRWDTHTVRASVTGWCDSTTDTVPTSTLLTAAAAETSESVDAGPFTRTPTQYMHAYSSREHCSNKICISFTFQKKFTKDVKWNFQFLNFHRFCEIFSKFKDNFWNF